MKVVAVISSDFINFTQYEKNFSRKVIVTLKKEIKNIKEQYANCKIKFSIYRGDSFQVLIDKPEMAFHLALQIKMAINQIHEKKNLSKTILPKADIRFSIGIGEANIKRKIEESTGEAFVFSGRELDAMKLKDTKTALITTDQDVNEEFAVHFKFLDLISTRWSVASAEVIYYLLKGYKEQQIADELGLSQAAVNYRKKAAGWDAVKVLLDRYKQVTRRKL